MSKLFLDDVRTPWDSSWETVRSAKEAIAALKANDYEEVSLDHDLESIHYTDFDTVHEETGFTVLNWMAENNKWPSKVLIIHTLNPTRGIEMFRFANLCAPDDLQIIRKLYIKS